MKMEECVNRYEWDYQVRLNPKTIEIYTRSVRQLFAYSGKQLDTVTKQDIRDWLGDLADNNYKPYTICNKILGLRAFFKYCEEEGYIHSNPAATIPFPRLEEKLPSYLTVKQLAELKRLVKDRRPVERIIVELLCTTGLRIGELLSMRREDIHWSERMIHVPKGKGKKGRVVLFTKECEVHFQAFLENQDQAKPHVFQGLRQKDKLIHPCLVAGWFQAYAKLLGFRVTPHMLRHTFAAHLAMKGMPLVYIQTLLGHEEPNQTRVYAKLYNHARKTTYDEFM